MDLYTSNFRLNVSQWIIEIQAMQTTVLLQPFYLPDLDLCDFLILETAIGAQMALF